MDLWQCREFGNNLVERTGKSGFGGAGHRVVGNGGGPALWGNEGFK
jgi:hypothetical protein